MRFNLHSVSQKTNIIEAYDKPELKTVEQVEQWCQEIVRFFNSSCRPGEIERVFVRAEILGESEPGLKGDALAQKLIKQCRCWLKNNFEIQMGKYVVEVDSILSVNEGAESNQAVICFVNEYTEAEILFADLNFDNKGNITRYGEVTLEN